MVEQGVCNAQIRVRFPVGPFSNRNLCSSDNVKFLGEGFHFHEIIIGKIITLSFLHY